MVESPKTMKPQAKDLALAILTRIEEREGTANKGVSHLAETIWLKFPGYHAHVASWLNCRFRLNTIGTILFYARNTPHGSDSAPQVRAYCDAAGGR